MSLSRTLASRWPFFAGLGLALAGAPPAATVAAAASAPAPRALDLATTPLLDGTVVAPNVLLTFDDSYSMTSAYVPDDLWTHPGPACGFWMSHTANPQAYNPSVTYTPPPKPDGTQWPDAAPTAVPLDALEPTNLPGTMDVTTRFRAPRTPTDWCAPADRAWYSIYNGSGDIYNDANYTKRYVTAGEMQNFANWFAYYRTRDLALRSTSSRVLSQLRYGSFRVAFQGLTHAFDMSTASTDPNSIPTIKTWDEPTRRSILERIQKTKADGATPSNTAYVRAGRYFQKSGINGPYATEPGVDGTEIACRRNYQVLFTDGQWNDPNFGGITRADYDGAAITLPAPDASMGSALVTSYTPGTPDTNLYKNTEVAPTQADVAFYFWSRDLRPDLPNRVKPIMGNRTLSVAPAWDPANDPATWQHLSTFYVTYGQTGHYVNDPNTNLPKLADGTLNWKPTLAGADPLAVIDDTWHAALNSRGGQYLASDPDTLLRVFKDIFEKISNTGGSSSTAAFSTGVLTSAGETAYASSYNASGWLGSLQSFSLDANGAKRSTNWDAACVLTGADVCPSGAPSSATPRPAPAARVIVAGDPDATARNAATEFTWSALTTAEQGRLNKDPNGTVDNRGEDRLNFLRGARDKELAQGGTFRNRTVVLGDIVGSQPVVVGPPQSGLRDNWGTGAAENANRYSDFMSANASRASTIYVGANDGMLHAFNTSGVETFAYVPRAAWDRLSALTRSPYVHQTFVDAVPTARDVYLSSGWATTLTSTLGTGGRGLFALNVTTPATRTTAADTLLWDHTYSDATTQPDIGYIYTAPYIARLADGHWWAVSGNGYNSPNGKAALVLVRMDNGAVKVIATRDGTDPVTPPRKNGLAGATLADFDSNGIAEYAYAGDLYGNLWKFDLRDTDSNRWALVGSNPIVTARAADGAGQSITSPPRLAAARPGGRIVVTFGTGKFLESSDLTLASSTQSLYGVFDDATGATAVTRSDLAAQTLADGSDVNGHEVRTLTSNAVLGKKGWVIDLPASGERVILQPALRDGLAFYSTLIPSGDSCDATGSGYVLTVDVGTGGPPSATVLDLNGDGTLNTADQGSNGNVAGFRTDGVPGSISIGVNEAGTDVIFIGGSGGLTTILSTTFRPRRVSWRQVH